jgi:SnoaL-like domain
MDKVGEARRWHPRRHCKGVGTSRWRLEGTLHQICAPSEGGVIVAVSAATELSSVAGTSLATLLLVDRISGHTGGAFMQLDHSKAADRIEPTKLRSIERVYELWDEALGARDVEAAAVLYAPDTVLESPLVRHLLRSETGIVRGREKLREFVRIVFERTPPARRRYRSGFFTDGKMLMWEYPRATPDGEQMDFVEVMEIEDGLIHRHRVYWGWFGVKVLQEDRYHR